MSISQKFLRGCWRLQCLLGTVSLQMPRDMEIIPCINSWQLLNGWLVSTSKATIYPIFCMCPTRKSLAASESFTQTWKCCWFRETLVHPVIDTPRIFSCFLHPDPCLDLSQGIKIPFLLYSGADCDKSLWGWDWLIWIFDSLYRMLAAPGGEGGVSPLRGRG